MRALVLALAACAASVVVGNAPTATAATLTVNLSGDGFAPGTLRHAVGIAQAGDTIRFDPFLPSEITLDSTITISKDLTIVGLGILELTLNSDLGPPLFVDVGASLTISDLRLSGVSTGIEAKNSGDVQIDRVVIEADFAGIDFDSPDGDLRLNGTFVDGHAQQGILVNRADAVVLVDSTARKNGSEGFRATDLTTSIGSLRLQNSDLSDNGAGGVEASLVTGDVVVVDSFLEANGLPGLRLDNVGGGVELTRTTAKSNVNFGVLLGSVGGDVEVDDLDASANTFGSGLEVDGVVGGAVSVSGSSFTANGGSGLFFDTVVADVTIDDTDADDNGADGVSVTGGDQPGSVDITNSNFRRNSSSGVSVSDIDGNVAVADADASDNGLSGVAVDEGTSGAVDIDRVVADSNRTGLFLSDIEGPTTVTDSTMSNSTEAGIFVDANTAVSTIERATVSANATGFTGLGSSSMARIVNSTFTANAALSTDATISSTLDSLEIRHSTLTGNALVSGAPLIRANFNSPVTLDHTIATGNGSGELSIENFATRPADVTAAHSLLPVGSGLGATNVEAAEPAVGPLTDNGGETATMLPDAESPAVDAGDPLIGSFPTEDQRGATRISGPAIDIGAVESAAPAAASAITSLAPARYVDTRSNGDTFDDRFQADGRRDADSEYRVVLAGRGGVPADARAVVINVTAVGSTTNGFVTAHPCVDPRPVASSLNYTPGVNMANEIVAPLTTAGELCLYTNRSIHLLVDVVGFVDARSPLVPLTPSRYLDTRPVGDTFDGRNEGAGRPGAQSTTTLPVAGRGGVPADAAAVIVNVTAVGASQRGFVTVHPCLDEPPLASSLNHVAGINRANELIASVDSDGNICLFTSRAIHLVVDVVGYLPAGSTFSAISPARFLDTRSTGETVDGVAQREGTVAAGGEYELQITGRPGVPDSATAVVVNVTAAGPDSRGFVTVHPCVDPPPNASSLNYVAGVNGANELITQLDADGKLCLFTNEPVDLIVDVVGWLG